MQKKSLNHLSWDAPFSYWKFCSQTCIWLSRRTLGSEAPMPSALRKVNSKPLGRLEPQEPEREATLVWGEWPWKYSPKVFNILKFPFSACNLGIAFIFREKFDISLKHHQLAASLLTSRTRKSAELWASVAENTGSATCQQWLEIYEEPHDY